MLNLAWSQGFVLNNVSTPRLTFLILDGAHILPQDLIQFLMNNGGNLLQLSSTAVSQLQLPDLLLIPQFCPHLEKLVACPPDKEGISRLIASNLMEQYPRIQFLFGLLPANLNGITKIQHHVNNFYDVDGQGTNLAARAIAQGCCYGLLTGLIHLFDIDVNCCKCVPPS